MNNYNTKKVEGYNRDLTMDCEEFNDNELLEQRVAEFFKEIDPEAKVISNTIGYILDEDNWEIGRIEEHYIDSGSGDYLYTAYIH